MSPTDLAKWHAAQMILDRVAPLANAVSEAAPRVPVSQPQDSEYALALAKALESYRDNLLNAHRRLALPPEPETPAAQPKPRMVF